MPHLIPELGQRPQPAIVRPPRRGDAEAHVGILGIGQNEHPAARISLQLGKLYFKSLLHGENVLFDENNPCKC
jgi:hypothetical protein